MEKFRVIFYPDKKSIEVAKDTTALSAATAAGVYINSVCGGEGVCGKCKIILKSGKVITQPSGLLTQEERKQHVYLACITTIHSDAEIEIPAESRLDFTTVAQKGLYSPSEEIDSNAPVKEGRFDYSPLARKVYLELTPPNLGDRISDLDRLLVKIKEHDPKDFKNIQTGLANIKQLGELLRDADWKVTVTLGKRDGITEIVAIEPQDTSKSNYGFAFDIGTTTISGQLVDLNRKKVLGTKAAYNKQASFGSDVISRIIYAQEEGGLEVLHQAVCETMNQIIRELIQEHSLNLNDATCILCTGNTTMMHLLLNIDPAHIRKAPYVPTANFLPTIRAAEVNIHINPRGLLSCVPGVASYVGGDTTAGVLSCGLYKEKDLSILIDIGTNGEIALGNKEFLVACAASAGPAFEGSGVACGMRASHGAIQKVKIDPRDFRVTFNTIANEKARGICGSGYIDLIAEMLRAGIIDKAGKIKAQDAKRIRKGEFGSEFVVAFKEEAATESDIVISEADIENLKRAKAAIYSATAILVKHMDLDFSKIKRIFIAGGFGISLDVASAVAIGLLPDLEKSKFVFVGNSALSGARQILLSAEATQIADEVARKITYFELSVDPGYMDEYMAALFFPHTDLQKFPSVEVK